MTTHIKQFIKFGYVGALGFIVDTAVLYVCIYIFGLGFYSGRAISYCFAVTTTWYLNRKFTFESRNTRIYSEWTRFFLVNLSGGAINYGVYSLMIYYSITAQNYPVLGVAVGSIAGMIVNFLLSKTLVFNNK